MRSRRATCRAAVARTGPMRRRPARARPLHRCRARFRFRFRCRKPHRHWRAWPRPQAQPSGLPQSGAPQRAATPPDRAARRTVPHVGAEERRTRPSRARAARTAPARTPPRAARPTRPCTGSTQMRLPGSEPSKSQHTNTAHFMRKGQLNRPSRDQQIYMCKGNPKLVSQAALRRGRLFQMQRTVSHATTGTRHTSLSVHAPEVCSYARSVTL